MQVEGCNRTVQAILSKMVKENQRDWDAQLPKALFAYRTSVHESTGFIPYHLKLVSSVVPERLFDNVFSPGSLLMSSL